MVTKQAYEDLKTQSKTIDDASKISQKNLNVRLDNLYLKNLTGSAYDAGIGSHNSNCLYFVQRDSSTIEVYKGEILLFGGKDYLGKFATGSQADINRHLNVTYFHNVICNSGSSIVYEPVPTIRKIHTTGLVDPTTEPAGPTNDQPIGTVEFKAYDGTNLSTVYDVTAVPIIDIASVQDRPDYTTRIRTAIWWDVDGETVYNTPTWSDWVTISSFNNVDVYLKLTIAAGNFPTSDFSGSLYSAVGVNSIIAVSGNEAATGSGVSSFSQGGATSIWNVPLTNYEEEYQANVKTYSYPYGNT